MESKVIGVKSLCLEGLVDYSTHLILMIGPHLNLSMHGNSFMNMKTLVPSAGAHIVM